MIYKIYTMPCCCYGDRSDANVLYFSPIKRYLLHCTECTVCMYIAFLEFKFLYSAKKK